MTTATITKTLSKEDLNDNTMSLGFRRFFILPARVKKAIQMAHLLSTGNINSHNSIVSFFESMTDLEYVNYLKNA